MHSVVGTRESVVGTYSHSVVGSRHSVGILGARIFDVFVVFGATILVEGALSPENKYR